MSCPVVVVTTKATVPSWRMVLEKFGVKPLLVTNYEQLTRGKQAVCRKHGTYFEWLLPADALIVFDECQKCKGLKSLNSGLLIAARRHHFRILLCSATAASNPLEMKALGFALGLHALCDFYTWARRHGVVDGFFGLQFNGEPDALKRIHESIFPHKGSRMTIANIPSFPATMIEATPIETGKAKSIQRVYDNLKRQMKEAQRHDDRDTLHSLAHNLNARSVTALTIQLRARQEIELLKADAMVAMAKDAVEEGMSVVLLVNFDATIEHLAAALNAHDSILRGGQSPTERQRVIDRFQANECPVVIANMQAGGVGVSLHDPKGIRPRLSLISPSFSAQDLRQALGRVHRAGGAASVQKILFAADTVEEYTADICATKLANIDLLNDGDLTSSIFTPNKKSR
ncbi:MAG: hypothetical protein IKK45_02300 [Akkermansia sp.]|nr:hypothetical protein [Akkermansia sp.]